MTTKQKTYQNVLIGFKSMLNYYHVLLNFKNHINGEV